MNDSYVTELIELLEMRLRVSVSTSAPSQDNKKRAVYLHGPVRRLASCLRGSLNGELQNFLKGQNLAIIILGLWRSFQVVGI